VHAEIGACAVPAFGLFAVVVVVPHPGGVLRLSLQSWIVQG
jgi:hypothetical protein